MVTLRPFALRDFAAVHALWRATEGIGLSGADTRPAIAQFLRRNRGMSLVATAGGTVVGAVLCGHDGRRGYLHHLVVDPGWRGRGLGRGMVAASLKRLAAAGIQKCNIFLYADNVKGGAFWRRNGWTRREDLRVVQHPTRGRGAGCERGC
jgi:ribosomal protein S18 acetylase RimI-like enzyme